MLFRRKEKRIYLDHASATKVHPHVLKAMEPYFALIFGNASAIHKEGIAARQAIETARTELAALLHVRPQGIVFTASGTESNNLALFGTIEARHKAGLSYADMEVISTAIEHPSVSEALVALKRLGVTVVYAPVDEEGQIKPEAFEECLTSKTVLVTCAYVNSEIGVIQNISRLSRSVRAAEKKYGSTIYMHADGAQAPLWLSCEVDKLGVDMLSLDAGKCCGPKGVGVLAFKHGVNLVSQLQGGPQEGGLRPGTENTALIVGAVMALRLAQEGCKARSEKIQKLRDQFIDRLTAIRGAVLNGSAANRVANNINISIPGIDSEFAVVTLDEKGIACSTKSACGSGKSDGSSVVRSITNDEAKALSTIRFTLGEDTKLSELMTAAGILETHVHATNSFLQKTIVRNS
jgi:cysteine desulfurase